MEVNLHLLWLALEGVQLAHVCADGEEDCTSLWKPGKGLPLTPGLQAGPRILYSNGLLSQTHKCTSAGPLTVLAP